MLKDSKRCENLKILSRVRLLLYFSSVCSFVHFFPSFTYSLVQHVFPLHLLAIKGWVVGSTELNQGVYSLVRERGNQAKPHFQ